jgi:hypothetical protein
MSTEPERDKLYYTNFNSALLATLIATEAISEGSPESRRKAQLIDTPSTNDISVVNAQAAASLYQPLQPDEIRLIELQRKVEDNEEVSCSLITVRLEDAPEYTALSYVWGSEADAATIRVDGIEFRVTQNLRDALATLQMPDQERLLWVDALAVNQNDVVERNEQIPRMREIYAAAQFVVIWLGKGDEKLEHLLWMIANVPDITPDSSLKLTMENWRTWCDAVNKYDPQASYFCNLNFAKFTALPYFSRVWVVQEIAYASTVYVIYGRNIVEYQQFYEFIHHMLRHAANTVSLITGTNSYTSTAIDQERVLLGPESGKALTGNFFTVPEWLDDCGRRSCRDPRDKIYGFYGCFPQTIRDRITIDYSNSAARVFSEMTKAVIQDLGSLAILDAIDDFRPDETPMAGLPSWSPDYSNPTRSNPRRHQPLNFQPNPNPAFFEFSQDDQVLHVQGVRIGTIKKTWRLSEVVIPRGFYPDRVPVDQFQLRVTQCCESLGVRQDLLLWMLMDYGGTQSDDMLYKKVSVTADILTGTVPAAEIFSAVNVDYLNKQWFGRAMFTLDTPNGGICSQLHRLFALPLGSARETVQAGDAVYAIEGAQKYMVLRKDGVNQKIVGSGYLRGQERSSIWTADELQALKGLEKILVV